MSEYNIIQIIMNISQVNVFKHEQYMYLYINVSVEISKEMMTHARVFASLFIYGEYARVKEWRME